MSNPGAGTPAPERSYGGPRAFGTALLALAVAALVATFAIGESDGLSVSGPRFVPLIVSIGMIALSLAFLARTTVILDEQLGRQAAEEAAVTTWTAPLLLGALFVAYVLLLEPIGFVVATILFIPLAARVLGSHSPLRDVAVGVLIGVGMYFAFTQFLGVPLPAGLVPF